MILNQFGLKCTSLYVFIKEKYNIKENVPFYGKEP